jgi:polyisoprenoid-binding protein YceI
MNTTEWPGWAGAALLFLIVSIQAARGASPAAPGPAPFEIDSTRSHAVIQVGKSGPFSFVAGHAHEVVGSTLTGVIGFDRDAPAQSTVRLEIDARTLKVTAKGEPPEDVPKVQEVMQSAKVLDVARFPSIRFDSNERHRQEPHIGHTRPDRRRTRHAAGRHPCGHGSRPRRRGERGADS